MHELLDAGRVEFDIVRVADVLVGALCGHRANKHNGQFVLSNAGQALMPFHVTRTQVVGPLTPVVFCNAAKSVDLLTFLRKEEEERTLNRVQTPHAPTLTVVLSAVPRMT